MHEDMLANLRRAYDAKAAERDGREISAWKAEERARFLAELERDGKPRLLEIGCGPGRDARFFQDRGFSVTCIDLSPNMVALCRDKGLEAYEMDLFHLDFPPQSFGAVFALNSLLHVPKASTRSVLRSIHGLLQSGGLFYMGVYGGEDVEGPWLEDTYEPKRFLSFYRDQEMIQLVSEVFDLVYFRRVESGSSGPVHFQSMILMRRGEPGAPAED